MIQFQKKKKTVSETNLSNAEEKWMKNIPSKWENFQSTPFSREKKMQLYFYFFCCGRKKIKKNPKKDFIVLPLKKVPKKTFERRKKEKWISFFLSILRKLSCSKCIKLSKAEGFLRFCLNLETWARKPLDRIMLKWSWTSPLLTIHNLVSQNWSSAKDPRASLIECLFPIKQNCSYLPDYRFDRLSDRSPELCVNRGALFLRA